MKLDMRSETARIGRMSAKSEIHRYIFSGKVHPERVDFSIQQSIGAYFESDGQRIELNISISKSILVIEMTTDIVLEEGETNKIETIKNNVLDTTSMIVDSFCYVKSVNYDLEISDIRCDELGFYYEFGVQGEWNLIIDDKQVKIDFTKIIIVLSDLRFKFIAHALSDFRRSIKYPAMTASFCYRAIETIRSSYFEDPDINDETKRRKDGWSKFRSCLSISLEEIQSINKYSIPNRHGRYPFISYDERERIMNLTRKIINAMLEEAIFNFEGFPEIVADD